MRVPAESMAVGVVMARMGVMGGVVRVVVHQWDFNRDSVARTAWIREGVARS
ncbi:MAG: hypothetical protein WB680_14180 [Candidatus Acidiferrales bacterium]